MRDEPRAELAIPFFAAVGIAEFLPVPAREKPFVTLGAMLHGLLGIFQFDSVQAFPCVREILALDRARFRLHHGGQEFDHRAQRVLFGQGNHGVLLVNGASHRMDDKHC